MLASPVGKAKPSLENPGNRFLGLSPRAELASEVDTLRPLPRLDTGKENGGLDEDDAPFPGDGGMLEDVPVDHGDVDDGEDGDPSGHDRPEEKLVAPDVVHPLGEVAGGFGLHAEERPPHVDHFPGEEEREPG